MVSIRYYISRVVDKVNSIPDLQTVINAIYDKLHPLPTDPRTIHYNAPPGASQKRIKTSNKVTTAKYNIITFLPKNLIEQFQRLANVYFLIISLLQLFTGLSPTGQFGTAIPLAIVIVAQMLKDIYEDLFRHKEDWKTNNTKAYVFRNGKLKTVKWKNVRTGDLIQVFNDQYFPADIVCLGSYSKKKDRSGNPRRDICYIETSQLDGETNLKIRRPFDGTKDLTLDQYQNQHYKVEYEPPNHFIYKFTGKITVEAGPVKDDENTVRSAVMDDIPNEEQQSQPLGPDNILLRGSMLKNTEWIIGLVMYTGKHTKLRLNSKRSPHKRSKIEKRINYYLFSLFAVQWIITICCVIARAIWNAISQNHWYIFNGPQENAAWTAIKSIITFFILFNNFIPISLYVSMELVKLLQARWFMNKDIKMYYAEKDAAAEAKSSSLNEELGQVEFIFSDKTGTLTQNKMELIKFGVKGHIYGYFEHERDDNNIRSENWRISDDGFQFWDNRINDGNWKTLSDRKAIEDFFLTLALCHDVIPERNDKNNPEKVEYTSPSPDEIALVKTVKHFGYEFIDKSNDSMTLKIDGQECQFKLLNVLEFSSKRKRMSVIVQFPHNNKIYLLSKGADSEMQKRMKQTPLTQHEQKETEENLHHMARVGLRTLVVGKAELSVSEYEHWQKNYFYPASIATEDREKLLESAYERVEKNLSLVGLTAIEDKLQNGVPEAISTLTDAGIKIWVLTGDKKETAVNIGKTCQMITKDMNLTIIDYVPQDSSTPIPDQKREVRDIVQEKYAELISSPKGSLTPNGLVVTGATLDLIIPPKEKGKKKKSKDPNQAADDELEALKAQELAKEVIYPGEEKLSILFLRLCLLCRAVICCRVAPLQKAQIVLLVKDNLQGSPTTLAIGDGANDVSMIQAAHIGVGISGEEGLQAAKAADYAIAQFEYLTRLLLVHGRWNYRRIAKLICYSFYKNAIVQLCNFFYVFFNGYTGKSLYENTSLALFNVFWASIPIMVLALFDQDVKPHISLRYPQLYVDGPNDYHFNLWVFLMWLFNALWQSLIIFFVPYGILQYGVLNGGKTPDDSFLGLVIFTSIVIVVNLKIMVESSNWTPLHSLSVLGSIGIWFVFLLIYSVLWHIVPKLNFFPFTSLEVTARSYYFAFYDAASSSTFWLTIFLVVCLCLLKDVIWKSFKRTFFKKYYHIMQDLQRRKSARALSFDDVKKKYSVRKVKSRTRSIRAQPPLKATAFRDVEMKDKNFEDDNESPRSPKSEQKSESISSQRKGEPTA
eukprot:CAMPEP_0117445648 /NCGR_PEP_ID=MMETSP0759-20121206/5911_1 /TAXON_ID=63605 /ORGANISM="Percolomonas cosmopolitus, Strain WS" /LENGTH=1276 /DNA_ID=CAMNT_0005237845 /DNA_START=155 /DNA_END=3985 /DNA_ORIENTATION=-